MNMYENKSYKGRELLRCFMYVTNWHIQILVNFSAQ